MSRAVHDVVNGNHAISGVRAMRPSVIAFGRFTGVSGGGMSGARDTRSYASVLRTN
jgi:hypothetical protein